MYQTMRLCIGIYGLYTGVRDVTKMQLPRDLCEKLDLPREAFPGSARLTVTAGRQALVENHRGILGYSEEEIVLGTGKGRISLIGDGLHLTAMNQSEVLIHGTIRRVEWE